MRGASFPMCLLLEGGGAQWDPFSKKGWSPAGEPGVPIWEVKILHKHDSLFIEVSSFQGVLIRGVPLYIIVQSTQHTYECNPCTPPSRIAEPVLCSNLNSPLYIMERRLVRERAPTSWQLCCSPRM